MKIAAIKTHPASIPYEVWRVTAHEPMKAAAAIIVEVIRNWDTVTGGTYGIVGIPRPWEFGNEVYKTEAAFAAFVAFRIAALASGVSH